jgi:hypothetical protein
MTMLLHLEKTLCFQTAPYRALQIFANLFLAESRKIKGLKVKKFGFSESRAAVLGFGPR